LARSPDEQACHDVVMAMFDAVLQPMDSSQVDRYMRPDYLQHSSMAGDGAEGLKAFIDEQHALYPDVVHDLKRTFVEGNHVFCHYHVRRFEGDPGFAVMDIFRVEGGKIAEHWDVIQPMPASVPNSNGMF